VSDGPEKKPHSFGDISIRPAGSPEAGPRSGGGPAAPAAASPGDEAGARHGFADSGETVVSEVVRSAPLRRGPDWRWSVPLVALVLLAIYTVGGFILLPGMLRSALIRWGSEQLEMTVRIDLVRCNPFTGRVVVAGFEAVPPGRNGPVILGWREADLTLAPSSLWRRAFIVKSLRLDIPTVRLVRQADRHYNLERLLPWLPLGDPAGRPGALLYALHNITISGGRLVFEDEPQGKSHLVDELTLTLPVLATTASTVRSTLEPGFSARINGSLLRFSGGEAATGPGTRLGFQLQQLDLVQYQNYWPWPMPDLVLRGGKADSDLSLVFHAGRGASRLTLDGSIELREVLLERGEGQVLRLPEARIEFSADPWQRQYHLREVTLRAPEGSLRLADAQGAGLGMAKGLAGTAVQAKNPEWSKASPAPEGDADTVRPAGLRLDHLVLDQGRLILLSGDGAKARRDELRELHLELRGLANQAAQVEKTAPPEPASIVCEALSAGGASEAALSLKGNLDEAMRLDARLSLQHLDLAWYQALLPGLAQARGVSGRGQLEGRLSNREGTAGTAGLQLSEGNLTLTDFSWQEESWGTAKGKELHCRGLVLDMTGRRGSCERLELRGTDLRPGPAATAAMFGLAPGKGAAAAQTAELWQWRMQALDIREGRWRLPLPQVPQEQVAAARRSSAPAELLLTDFSLQAKDLLAGAAGGENTLTLSARLGEKGHVQALGPWRLAGGENKLQLDVKDAELVLLKPLFSPWLRPEISGGRMQLHGTLAFPGTRFVGTARLEDVRAGREDESRLGIGSLSATGMAVTLAPFHLGIGELAVRQAEIVVRSSSADQVLPAGAQAFFHLPQPGPVGKKPAAATISIAPLEVQRIELEGSSLRLPVSMLREGLVAELTALRGTVADFRLLKGARYVYDLSARPARGAAEAEVVLRGEGNLGEGAIRGLVEGQRLSPVLFAEMEELGSVKGWMDLNRQWPEGADGATVSRIDVRGLRPKNPADPLASALALLTGEDGLIHLRIEDVPGEEDAPPLAASVTRLLRRYSVKAELSPTLVLAETWPELQPAREIRFSPGGSTLDETARQALIGQEKLLRQRPALVLRIKPGIDGVADRSAIQERLQREADALRAEENRHREQLRQERVAAELKRLAAEAVKRGDNKAITVESLPPEPPELAPLPPETVAVPEEMLHQLAHARAETVRDFLLRDKGVPARRLVLDEAVSEGGAALVRFGVGADFARAEFSEPARPAPPD